MNISDYTNYIYKKLKSNLNIKFNYNLCSEQFNLFAYNSLSIGRTFLTSTDIIDNYISNEYILIKHMDNLNSHTIDNLLNSIINVHNTLVVPCKKHKSSYITVVLTHTNFLDSNINKKIKKFKYEKIYKLYFYGFSEIRLIAINLNNNSIISNKCGKNYEKIYLPAS